MQNNLEQSVEEFLQLMNRVSRAMFYKKYISPRYENSHRQFVYYSHLRRM